MITIQSPKAKMWASLIINLVVGVLGQLVALQVFTGDGLRVAQVLLATANAVAATIGVYLTPNRQAGDGQLAAEAELAP